MVPIKFSVSAFYKNSHARQPTAIFDIPCSIDRLINIAD
jgi:hypothetical protein